MTTTAINPATARELQRLHAGLAKALAESLSSFLSRTVALGPTGMELVESATLLPPDARPQAVIRTGLGNESGGKTLAVMFEVQDAVAMAGLLLLAPEPIIEQRRQKSTLEGEDLEAFREIANLVCSGLGPALGGASTGPALILQETGVVAPGGEAGPLVGTGSLFAFNFSVQIDKYAPGRARIVIDMATAQRWNKGPFALGEPEASPAPDGSAKQEDIPQAPIRGMLSAFLAEQDLFAMVHQSCRRVGLDLKRFGRNDIPNPAAHRGEIVLFDVPPADDRRFDWCRRIKGYCTDVKVVLLIHHPSRARVVQGFLGEADVILGLPVDERALSQKLTTLIEAPAD